MTNLDNFFKNELEKWPLAAENFTKLDTALKDAVALSCNEDGNEDAWQLRKVLVDHRRASITAKTDAGSIAHRPCFLCAANRPPEQGSLHRDGFEILVNPYPLSPRHYTIASVRHEDQRIEGRIRTMASLTRELVDLCVFYNGPRCGASAPDHLHFQAVDRSTAVNILNPALPLQKISESDGGGLFRSLAGTAPFTYFIIDTKDDDATLERLFGRLMASLPTTDPEPAVNIAMVLLADGRLRTFVAPRRRHRPECYGAGDDALLVSPATIEMLGTLVCSRAEDFRRLDGQTAGSILSEVGF